MKKCVLYDRECIECGECNVCDLDPTKLCDNCMKCVNIDADYSEVIVDDIIDGNENALPIENPIDSKQLKRAWEDLRRTGKWTEKDERKHGDIDVLH